MALSDKDVVVPSIIEKCRFQVSLNENEHSDYAVDHSALKLHSFLLNDTDTSMHRFVSISSNIKQNISSIDPDAEPVIISLPRLLIH